MKKYTGQLNYTRGMSEAEIHKVVTDYSGGAKPKETKSQKIIHSAFREVHANTPKVVQKTMYKKGPEAAEKQRVAIALSKARAKGARGIRKQ
jgi:hypothetical protein